MQINRQKKESDAVMDDNQLYEAVNLLKGLNLLSQNKKADIDHSNNEN